MSGRRAAHAESPTRVAFIWPEGLGAHLLRLAYAALAANTPARLCEFRLFDLAIGQPSPAALEKELALFAPDVVGITAHAMNFGQAASAARAAHRAAPGSVIVAGGPHPSACPACVLKERSIDFVIRGEAELAFPAFINELRSAAPRWTIIPGLARRDGEPDSRPAAGLLVRGFFIVGYPGETRDDLRRTLELIRAGRFDFVELMFFQPLPGTAVFEELAGRGEISRDFLPASFSTGELPYTPPGLRGINFGWLFLRERLAPAFRSPAAFLRCADLRAGAGRFLRQELRAAGRYFLFKTCSDFRSKHSRSFS